MEKINFERDRQIFHLFFGISIVLLLMYGFIYEVVSLFMYGIWEDITSSNFIIRYAEILFILFLIILGLILSFFSRRVKIPIIYQLLQKFERKNELERFPGKGVIFYLIGIDISLLLFPKDIAMASILVLALGDSVSHLYGLHYGKIKLFSKTKFLEGTIAGFIAGFLGASVFLPWHEAFLASLAAMIVEAIEIKIGTQQVDDNLIVPFVAGAVVWLVRLF